jgi:two-component system NtrC family sensor kinase
MKESKEKERILLVDEDPEVLDLLSRQLLQPMGYRISSANDAGTAIQQAINFNPDLIVASLTLPGLSGKDLLVALRSQGMEVPVLVTAHEGMEADAIQAFRLGAEDYLVKPLREAEVVATVERALKEIRLRYERSRLAQQLAESNQKLERRVRELTTMYGIGKAVTSVTHQGRLFDMLMESSLSVTEADMGWVVLQDDSREELVLRAQQGLPDSFSGQVHKTWDDGISSLVMLSHEALSIYGEGLSKFQLAQFATSALIVPIKVRDQPIGVIAVARKQARPFTEANQRMLQALADYASISLVNVRLFQALEGRAEHLQKVLDDTHRQVEKRSDWLGGINKDLEQAQKLVAALVDDDEIGELQSGLQELGAKLESALDNLSKMPGLETQELPAISTRN